MIQLPYIPPPPKLIEFGRDLPIIGDHMIVSAFIALITAGVLVGVTLCSRVFARAKGLDQRIFRDQLFWALLFGFLFAHWFYLLVYSPTSLIAKPEKLLVVTSGMSSVGGFMGGIFGGYWFLQRKREPALVYFDGNVFGLLTGMCFGRLGCALAHDHPGRIVEPGTFLAVGPWPHDTGHHHHHRDIVHQSEIWRWDLGLIEFLFLVGLTVFVYALWDWRNAKPGKLTGLVATGYGVVRFLLEFFRAQQPGDGVAHVDARYLGLTPAQYTCMAFIVLGVWLLFIRKANPRDESYTRAAAGSTGET